MKGEAEIIHQNEIIGYAKYEVQVCVLAAGFDGDYNYAPYGDEVEFELNGIEMQMMFNECNIEMPNVTERLNQMLSKEVGKILKF